MTDLFGHNPAPKQPKRSVGYGNAMFLCDLADHIPDDKMRETYRAGGYPDLRESYIAFWRRMAGRTTQPRHTGTTGEI